MTVTPKSAPRLTARRLSRYIASRFWRSRCFCFCVRRGAAFPGAALTVPDLAVFAFAAADAARFPVPAEDAAAVLPPSFFSSSCTTILRGSSSFSPPSARRPSPDAGLLRAV